MIKNIFTLIINDIGIAFKNKTIYLILFIPFFVFLSLRLIDHKTMHFQKTHLGLSDKDLSNTNILRALKSVNSMFIISHVLNEKEGIKLLKDKKIDGLLLKSSKEENSLVLMVLKKESLVTVFILESISALQKQAEERSPNWISEVRPLEKWGIQKQSLPTWILMLVLLVSFIIMPAQVAEEKEKKLILALLQTPMREIEWLIAKLFVSILLIFIAVLFLHLLGHFQLGNSLSYVTFLGIGSFCFSSYGILLGLLCRNQASARALGVIFYLPHLLPAALSDFSKKLMMIAPVLPSYQFYGPIKLILFEEKQLANFSLEGIYLLAIGLLSLFFSYHLMKKRWLM